jgi:catechol 2,3-dioxygenase-like lactoylglutathione lyase family enzyme
MLGASDLIAFIPTADLVAARRFYADTLGLPITSESPFACVFDAGGTMLRVTPVPAPARASYTVLGWRVGDIATTVRGLTNRAVSFLRYDGMDQDELGIWTTPGGDRVAWFHDLDGNTLSLTQFTGGGTPPPAN